MTAPGTAVILAAGRGQRLGERGLLAPKGFLTLGDRPIVEESILKLREAGVSDVVVVTGHLAEHYEALAARYPGLVRTLHNPAFAESGSMYSLYLAALALPESFLLLESDLIYEHRALDEILATRSGTAILVSGFTQSGDEVYIEARDDLLAALSKDRRQLGSGVIGELVGISRVDKPAFAAMCRHAETIFARTLKLEYEHALVAASQSGHPVLCHRVPDLVWSEIDDVNHLERARDRVYPAIRARDAARAQTARVENRPVKA